VTKTVAITGASAGIGRAAARLFGQRGDRVALIARGHAGLERAVRDVERAGGNGSHRPGPPPVTGSRTGAAVTWP
jgi:NAD(P)-dependent dehydrogenase (short-subunit alcohol dehydrogenase family)